jgi:hypothetical protein
MLLKSSDFVTHDLSADSVFEGCVGGDGVSEGYRLELVLRKWFAIDPSREMRAFVRDGVLIGMCAFSFTRVCACVRHVSGTMEASRSATRITTGSWMSLRRSARSCRPSSRIGPRTSSQSGPVLHPVRSTAHPCSSPPPPNILISTQDTFDVLLTRDLSRFHILDFNPYALRTDALLFTYAELAFLFSATASSTTIPTPVLRVIDSQGHPNATRNAPEHQHNMVPLEVLTLSQGRNMEEFAAAWVDQVRRGAVADDSDDGSEE